LKLRGRHLACLGLSGVDIVVRTLTERWIMMCRSLCAGMLLISLDAWEARAESGPVAEVQGQLTLQDDRNVSQPVLVGTEAFPRIAMLWSSAQDLEGTRPQRMAKYGVSVVGVEALGLRWERVEHPDLAETFEPATIHTARATLAEVVAANPRTVVCCELYF